MFQDNTLNVTLSNSQINKLKSGKKSEWSNLKNVIKCFHDSSNENDLLIIRINCYQLKHKFQGFVKLANNSKANVKLCKARLDKIEQTGGFLGRLLGTLLKTGLPLMKNVFQALAKEF